MLAGRLSIVHIHHGKISIARSLGKVIHGNMSFVSHNMHNEKGKAGVKLEIAEKAYNNEHRNEP